MKEIVRDHEKELILDFARKTNSGLFLKKYNSHANALKEVVTSGAHNGVHREGEGLDSIVVRTINTDLRVAFTVRNNVLNYGFENGTKIRTYEFNGNEVTPMGPLTNKSTTTNEKLIDYLSTN